LSITQKGEGLLYTLPPKEVVWRLCDSCLINVPEWNTRITWDVRHYTWLPETVIWRLYDSCCAGVPALSWRTLRAGHLWIMHESKMGEVMTLFI
jgi:hypothetical protein